jgi:hypothetical protein
MTLKPMMIALDASARRTSLSVMPPTAAWSTRTLTSVDWLDLLALGLEHVDRALLGGLEDDEDFLDVLVGHLAEQRCRA